MGKINKDCYQFLHSLRQLRNKCAHSDTHFDLENKDYTKFIDEIGTLDPLSFEGCESTETLRTARSKLINGLGMLAVMISIVEE